MERRGRTVLATAALVVATACSGPSEGVTIGAGAATSTIARTTTSRVGTADPGTGPTTTASSSPSEDRGRRETLPTLPSNTTIAQAPGTIGTARTTSPPPTVIYRDEPVPTATTPPVPTSSAPTATTSYEGPPDSTTKAAVVTTTSAPPPVPTTKPRLKVKMPTGGPKGPVDPPHTFAYELLTTGHCQELFDKTTGSWVDLNTLVDAQVTYLYRAAAEACLLRWADAEASYASLQGAPPVPYGTTCDGGPQGLSECELCYRLVRDWLVDQLAAYRANREYAPEFVLDSGAPSPCPL